MAKHNLTVEISGGDEISVHGDEAGLQFLVDHLQRLLDSTKPGHFNHEHLNTEDWGGDELNSTLLSDSAKLINHVRLYCWKGSKSQI